jgi:hypothetical protein
MRNTQRALDFFAFLHLTIFERPANLEFFEQSDNLWRENEPGRWVSPGKKNPAQGRMKNCSS